MSKYNLLWIGLVVGLVIGVLATGFLWYVTEYSYSNNQDKEEACREKLSGEMGLLDELRDIDNHAHTQWMACRETLEEYNGSYDQCVFDRMDLTKTITRKDRNYFALEDKYFACLREIVWMDLNEQR